MRLRVLALAAGMLTASCGTASHQTMMDGTHEVAYRFEPMLDTGNAAESALVSQAEELCARGWKKLSERRIGTMSDGGSVIWHIACL